MRKTQLGLALVASAHLALLTSPAFADPPAAAAPAPAAPAAAPAPRQPNKGKVTTGWVLFGVGAAATVAGIVVDAVGTGQGSIAGQGAPGDSGVTDNTRNDFYFVGTTLLVAGLATAFYGGSLVWSGNRGDSTNATPPPEDDASGGGATKAVQARLASSPTFTVPLLGAKF